MHWPSPSSGKFQQRAGGRHRTASEIQQCQGRYRSDKPHPTLGKNSTIPLETLTQHLLCDLGKVLFHHLRKDPQTLQECAGSWENPCTITDPRCWLPANVSFGVSLFCPNEFGVSPPSLTVGAASSWSQARNFRLGVPHSLAQFLGLLP